MREYSSDRLEISHCIFSITFSEEKWIKVWAIESPLPTPVF